jgi:hypothetical protein
VARSTRRFGLAAKSRNAILGSLASILLVLARYSPAHAGPCTRTITQCPCTIMTGGKFKVMSSLTSTSLTRDCITVAARRVSLDLAGNSITGPGSNTPTAGIHVLRRASRVTITGGSAMISQFGSGLFIEGSRASASGFNADANQNGLIITSDRGAYTSFDASGNSNDGVLLSAASRNSLSAFTANSNTVGNGVELGGPSNRNSISGFIANSNGGAGVDLHKGNCQRSCGPANQPNRNLITGAAVTGNGTYGIVVFDGHRETISDSSATSNVTDDLFDTNVGCDHNRWFGNTFTSANRKCIH